MRERLCKMSESVEFWARLPERYAKIDMESTENTTQKRISAERITDWSDATNREFFDYSREDLLGAGPVALERLRYLLDREMDNVMMRSMGLDAALMHLCIGLEAQIRKSLRMEHAQNRIPMVLATWHDPTGGSSKDFNQGAIIFKPYRFGWGGNCGISVSRLDIASPPIYEGHRRIGMSGLVFKSHKVCATTLLNPSSVCSGYLGILPHPDRRDLAPHTAIAIPLFSLENRWSDRFSLPTTRLANEPGLRSECLCAFGRRNGACATDAEEMGQAEHRPVAVLNVLLEGPAFLKGSDEKYEPGAERGDSARLGRLKPLVSQLLDAIRDPLELGERVFHRWRLKRPGRKAVRLLRRSSDLVNNRVNAHEAVRMALHQLVAAFASFNISFHRRDPLDSKDRIGDDVGATLRLIAVAGRHGRGFLLGTEYPVGSGVVGKAYAEQKIVVQYVDPEAGLLPGHGEGAQRTSSAVATEPLFHQLFPRTAVNMAIPVFWRDRLQGILNVESEEKEVFGELEVDEKYRTVLEASELMAIGNETVRKLLFAADNLGLLVYYYKTTTEGEPAGDAEVAARVPANLEHRIAIARYVSDHQLLDAGSVPEARTMEDEGPETGAAREAEGEGPGAPEGKEKLEVDGGETPEIDGHLNSLLNAALISQRTFGGKNLWGSASLVNEGKLDIRAIYGRDWPGSRSSFPVLGVDGDSVTGTAASEGRSVFGKIRRNSLHDERPGKVRKVKYKQAVPGLQLQSELAVPIIHGKDTLGVIATGSSEKDTYSGNQGWSAVKVFREWSLVASWLVATWKNAALIRGQAGRQQQEYWAFLRLVFHFLSNAPLEGHSRSGLVLNMLQGTVVVNNWAIWSCSNPLSDGVVAERNWECKLPTQEEKRLAPSAEITSGIEQAWIFGQGSFAKGTTLGLPLSRDGRLEGAIVLETAQPLAEDGRRELLECWGGVVGGEIVTSQLQKREWVYDTIQPENWWPDQLKSSRGWVDLDGLLRDLPDIVTQKENGLSACITYRVIREKSAHPEKRVRAFLHAISEKFVTEVEQRSEWSGSIGTLRSIHYAHDDPGIVPLLIKKGGIFRLENFQKDQATENDSRRLRVRRFRSTTSAPPLAYLGFPLKNRDGEVVAVVELFRERKTADYDWRFTEEDVERSVRFQNKVQEQLIPSSELFDYRFSTNEIQAEDLPELPGGIEAAKLVGASPALASTLVEASRRARLNRPVLIVGKPGVGKSLVARYIHAKGAQRDRVFAQVNAAGLPETLIASELFGHKRGSFSGATEDREGLIESAGGGTVVIDEAHELTKHTQSALNLAIEDGTIKRVGDNRQKNCDAQFIALTNHLTDGGRDPEIFRQDFLSRFREVRVPDLGMRTEDIPMLIQAFFELEGIDVEGIRGAALAELKRYSWPNNVRELRECVRDWTDEFRMAAAVVSDDASRVGGIPESWVTLDMVRASLPLERALASARSAGVVGLGPGRTFVIRCTLDADQGHCSQNERERVDDYGARDPDWNRWTSGTAGGASFAPETPARLSVLDERRELFEELEEIHVKHGVHGKPHRQAAVFDRLKVTGCKPKDIFETVGLKRTQYYYICDLAKAKGASDR